MPARTTALQMMATPCAGSLRAIPVKGWHRLFTVLTLLTTETGVIAEEAGAPRLTNVEATVAYVSEVPWQWNGEQGNPLEKWARQLSADWANHQGDGEERLRNLLPELSWKRLAITASSNMAGAFVVHGYEWIENGAAAGLDALLIPSKDGKADMTEFVILRQRTARTGGDRPKFNMEELFEKQILVDRGGCGELVYRWLDREIRPETGTTRREDHADFRSAASPAQAVLSVYFGEADACVVSRSSYVEVQRTNPKGLVAKLEEVRTSPRLLKHVIACPRAMPLKRRAEVVKSAAAVRLQQPDGTCSLTVPKDGDFKELRQLITDWQKLFGEGIAANPGGTPPPGSAPAIRNVTPAAPQPSERRMP